MCSPDGILFGSCTQEQPLCQPITMTIAMANWKLLENKAKLQLVEIAILIGQFQTDRHFNVQLRKSIPSILSEKHNRFTFLNLVIMR